MAVNTSKIRLGTGVLIPSNRIPAVSANAFATLNKLAPGRIDFGVGTGFTGRRAMGVGAMKLSAMEAYIRTVYGLLAGEKVETEFEGKPARIRFLNPEAGCINIDDPVRLTISAFGPLGRRLTAEMQADWMTFTNGPDAATAQLADYVLAPKICLEREDVTLLTDIWHDQAHGCCALCGQSSRQTAGLESHFLGNI